MTTAAAVRVLPADVFDALELSALVYKGVGAGSWYGGIYNDDYDAPCCIHGHAAHVADIDVLSSSPVRSALRRAGVSEAANDEAVRAINRRSRRGIRGSNDRVPFALWAQELGVVRGDT